MEYFPFCMKVLQKEQQRFNVTLDSQDVDSLTNINASYDLVYNRCAYMYKYAPCGMHFVHDCMNKFLSGHPDINDLILKWRLRSDMKLCSLSSGPALDYISFMLAFSGYECFTVQPLFKSIKLITKCGAWRNTINFMFDAIHEGELKNFSSAMVQSNNIEVIQGDPFHLFIGKLKNIIRESDVILMIRGLNLVAPGTEQEKEIAPNLKEIFAMMKPDALLFCIDTKPSVALLVECLFWYPGKFLFPPTSMSGKIPAVFPAEYKISYGCFPVLSARGDFFVWQKLGNSVAQQNIANMPNYMPSGTLTHAYKQTSSNFDNVENSDESDLCVKEIHSDTNSEHTLAVCTTKGVKGNNSPVVMEKVSQSDSFVSAISRHSESGYISESSTQHNLSEIANNDMISDISLKMVQLEKFLNHVSVNKMGGNAMTNDNFLKDPLEAVNNEENDVKDMELNKSEISFAIKPEVQNISIQTDFEMSDHRKESNNIQILINRIKHLTMSFEDLLIHKDQECNEMGKDNCKKYNENQKCKNERCANALSTSLHENNCCHNVHESGCSCMISCCHSKRKLCAHSCGRHQAKRCAHSMCYGAANFSACVQHGHCFNEHAASCHVPDCSELHYQHQNAASVPNIVIPLDNANSEVVSRIISVLANR